MDSQRSTRKFISLYSAQKNYEMGNGRHSVSLKADDPELEDRIKELKDKQRQENIEWKEKMHKKEPIERKYQPREYRNADGNPVDPPAHVRVKELKSRENSGAFGEVDPMTQRILVPKTFDKTPFKLLLDKGTGNTTFILGSSKMGKSTALMKVYDKYYKLNSAGDDSGFISTLWTCNPQIQLYKKHKNLLVAGCWNKNGEEIIKQQKKIQTGTNNKYKFLNIFDDVISVRNNVLLDNLILTYRNSKMSSIISLQYSNLMSKCSRANCNNIMAFGFNTDESIEVVIKTFLSGYLKQNGIIKLPDQINWYKMVTANHSFIYIKPADGVVSFHRFNL